MGVNKTKSKEDVKLISMPGMKQVRCPYCNRSKGYLPNVKSILICDKCHHMFFHYRYENFVMTAPSEMTDDGSAFAVMLEDIMEQAPKAYDAWMLNPRQDQDEEIE